MAWPSRARSSTIKMMNCGSESTDSESLNSSESASKPRKSLLSIRERRRSRNSGKSFEKPIRSAKFNVADVAANILKKIESNSERIVTPNISVPDTMIPNPNSKYASNSISTSKYNVITFLPKNLFEQFHRYANLYFLFIQILNWLPGIEVFIKEIQLFPLIFVLSVTAIKDLYEDLRRHHADYRVNRTLCWVYDKKRYRFKQIAWKDLKVGDYVHLTCDEQVPADILLLRTKHVDANEHGYCYIQTTNLDGESNLKQRYIAKDVVAINEQIEHIDFDFRVFCGSPNMKLYKFNGTIVFNDRRPEVEVNKDNILLRGCKVKNTGFVEGLVLYAGHETKSMLNNKGPRMKRSRLEKVMNGDIVWSIVLLIILCTISALGRKFWINSFPPGTQLDQVPYLSVRWNPPFEFLRFMWVFFTYIILYQMIIPVSLYVCIEMVKLGQVRTIQKDPYLNDAETGKRVECRATNITEDLGQIEYMFCDKTGTLTENQMRFRCCTINGIDYTHCPNKNNSDLLNNTVNEFESNEKLQLALNGLNKKIQRFLKEKEKSDSKKRKTIAFTAEEERLRDFFMTLAICNGAVATNKKSFDVLNEPKVSQIPEAMPSTTPISIITGKLIGLLRCDNQSRSLTSEVSNSLYESESPDEVALVLSAYHYGYKLKKRSKDYVKVELPFGKQITYQVLNVLPFDSNRKRMSIIVRCPFTNRIMLLCKGSDTTVLSQLSDECNNIMENELKLTVDNLEKYSTKGYRVLCMARRFVGEEEYSSWAKLYRRVENKEGGRLKKCQEMIESNLELLGCTGIEDRLQHRVPQVIENLRNAGIVIWVLTGDKVETAINIAQSCSLFNSEMELIKISLPEVKSRKTAKETLLSQIEHIRQQIDFLEATEKTAPVEEVATDWPSAIRLKLKILYDILNWRQKLEFVDEKLKKKWGLVVDGPSLNYVLDKENLNYFIELTQYCSSVLCCRMSPLQKAAVVKAIMSKLNALTMAVGDGANDVTMIQAAHVGIGISGLEGTQAVMASDFSVSRFHFLERLILVHGNLSYNRMAVTILFFFYKNTMTIVIIFLFQFYCGFSGKSLIDDVYLMAVNTFYTTFPSMVRGIYEKDYSEEVFLQYPKLYERGRKSKVYTDHSFWVNTTDSTFQSFVIFFITYHMYADTAIDVFQFGLIIFIHIVNTNLLLIALETSYWNLYYLLSFICSYAFLLATILLLDNNYSQFLITKLGGHNYCEFLNTAVELRFYLSLVIVPIICLIPRVTIRGLQSFLKPQFDLKNNL